MEEPIQRHFARPPSRWASGWARRFKAGWRGHSLPADQPLTIVLDDFLRLAPPAKFGGADISIIVEYQPWLVPLRQEKEFRFATELGTDSRLYWASRPTDE